MTCNICNKELIIYNGRDFNLYYCNSHTTFVFNETESIGLSHFKIKTKLLGNIDWIQYSYLEYRETFVFKYDDNTTDLIYLKSSDGYSMKHSTEIKIIINLKDYNQFYLPQINQIIETDLLFR